jgi:catechol 2,3-dioxygenase-like lactoylglutathione lyase family enzyme
MADETRLTAIGQIARTVRDIAESEAWYRDALGLEHLFTFDTLAFFDCGGTRLMLSQSDDPKADESLIYFRVADIDLACDALSKNGVNFVRGAERVYTHADGTEEWMAFFEDPENRTLALMTSRQP